MNNKLQYTALFFCFCLFGSCNEDRLEPADTKTFIKMYGDSKYPLTAVDARLHPDGGFVLLANAEYKVGEGANEAFALMPKIIKTDKNGNIVAQNTLGTGRNEVSYALEIAGPDSYLIVGKHIHENKEDFMVIETNNNGEIVNRFTKQFTLPARARAVTVLKNGNYFVIGEVGSGNVSSFAVELSPDFTEVSSRLFEDTKTSITNKVFENNKGLVYWAGNIDYGQKKGNLTGYTPGGLIEVDDEFPKDNASSFEVTSFYSSAGSSNFGFLGTDLGGSDKDVKFVYASEHGKTITETTFKGISGDDIPSSITQASDGGFLALSTSDHIGQGRDFMLLKINGSTGENMFAEPLFFGGENDEEAAAVLTTPDGGILMFGTTVFANVNTLLTIKINVNGEF